MFKDALALAATPETLVSEVPEVNKESTGIYQQVKRTESMPS